MVAVVTGFSGADVQHPGVFQRLDVDVLHRLVGHDQQTAIVQGSALCLPPAKGGYQLRCEMSCGRVWS